MDDVEPDEDAPEGEVLAEAVMDIPAGAEMTIDLELGVAAPSWPAE